MTGPQGAPDWVASRRGFLTASRMKDACGKTKTGWSDSRRKLMFDIVAERMTGIAVSHYVTEAMLHGTEQEPYAVAAYEALSGELATECGFIEHSSIEFFGASPDRLLGAEGLIECKCPTTQTFLNWITAGVVPKDHHLQMLAQLACTRRKFCDFVAFDPRMPESKQLFIRRFEPTAQQIADIEAEAELFLRETQQLFDLVTSTPAAA